MGCCSSTPADQTSAQSSSPDKTVTTQNPNSRPMSVKRNGKEDTIELVFKAKRANVFAQGLDDSNRKTYKAKRIPKTAKQAQTISVLFKLIFIIYLLVIQFYLH